MAEGILILYVMVFAITLAATALLNKILIPFLRGKASQPIYKDGPKWHISKSGTPTMGGLSFLISTVFVLSIPSVYLFAVKDNTSALSLLICLGYAIMNSVIGVIDDSVKLKRKENLGLKPFEKLVLQFLTAILFLVSRYIFLGSETILCFASYTFDLGILYYPLAIIILLGITNCANLTDGIDGLASSVAFAAGTVLFYISYSLNPEVGFISSAVMGSAIGFLFFNIHPAKIFMGDTGSLFLGSVLVSCAFAMNNMLIIIPICAVYVIEGISVILQVFVYKLTKKRLFKMAPIHHHLEKCGWDENKICLSALLLTLITSLVSFLAYTK